MLKGAPGIAKDLEELVLSSTNDAFFARHRYANFGELGSAVNGLVAGFAAETKSTSTKLQNEQIKSIEDIESFVERYPAYRQESANVAKHVAISSELSRLVELTNLFDVSALEQSLACSDEHSTQLREITEKLESPDLTSADKLRLAILYALRYETSGNLGRLKEMMAEGGCSPSQVHMIDQVLQYAGEVIFAFRPPPTRTPNTHTEHTPLPVSCPEQSKRTPGLYGDRSFLSRVAKNFGSAVDNIYTQHVPLLVSTLHSCVQGKVRGQVYLVRAGERAGERSYHSVTWASSFARAH